MPSLNETSPLVLSKELQDTIARARFAIVRHVWIIASVFFIVMTLLALAALLLIPPAVVQDIQKGIVPKGSGEADFIKLFVPIFALAFGFVVGFLGLKRLEQFDAEITDLRNSLGGQVLEERKLFSAQREAFRREIDDRMNEIRQSIETLTERYATKALESRLGATELRIDKFQKDAELTIETIEDRLKPFLWLEEKKEEVEYLVGVHTMGVAHERVSDFFSEKKLDLALRVARYAIEQKLPGTPTDYHNIAASLARHDQEPYAVKIITLGLDNFPNDVDLLASGIKYGSSIGQTGAADALYQSLIRIEFDKWNWRGFVFAGDYLEMVGKVEESFDLYEEFRKQIPDDERAYSQPGIYLRRIGKFSQAIEILKAGVTACRKCAQCAFALSEIYLDQGEYRQAILMTNRGSEASADEQPSINQSAIHWNRALAEDALIHRLLEEKGDQVALDELTDIARHAAIDYRTAITMVDTLSVFRLRAPDRLATLRALLEKQGADQGTLSEIFGDQHLPESSTLELFRSLARETANGAERGSSAEIS